MSKIGDRIEIMQRALDLNDTELASRLRISKSTVGKWKLQGATPSGRTLIAIRERLGVSDQWLLHGKGPMKIGESSDDFTRTLYEIVRDLDPQARERILEAARYEAWKTLTRNQ